MDNSNSQKSLDNSALFANCAKDWDFYGHEESCVVEGDVYKDCAESNNLTGQSDLGSQKNKNKKNKKPNLDSRKVDKHHGFHADNGVFTIVAPPTNPLIFLTEQEDTLAYEGTTLTHLSSVLESAFIQHSPLSYAQSEAKAKELLLLPKKNLNWHLCLMGYHAHNISENLQDVADRELHDPLEGVVPWLAEGMEKGWLRHVDIEAFASPLHHAFLSQEIFWQHFVSTCDRRNNRLSLVLFKIEDTAHKKRETSELIEQILIATKNQDFFGEIHGFGVALALPNSGSFGATACAECIISRMGKVLQNMSIKVGVAEAEEGENADTLFAHAKEALAKNQEDGLEVQVYRSMNKGKKNNSLVQSEEKRFLFFGAQ